MALNVVHFERIELNCLCRCRMLKRLLSSAGTADRIIRGHQPSIKCCRLSVPQSKTCTYQMFSRDLKNSKYRKRINAFSEVVINFLSHRQGDFKQQKEKPKLIIVIVVFCHLEEIFKNILSRLVDIQWTL